VPEEQLLHQLIVLICFFRNSQTGALLEQPQTCGRTTQLSGDENLIAGTCSPSQDSLVEFALAQHNRVNHDFVRCA
jgi:hypothetical protein